MQSIRKEFEFDTAIIVTFRLQSLLYCRKVALLFLFYIYIQSNCSDEFSSVVTKLYKFKRGT